MGLGMHKTELPQLMNLLKITYTWT